MRTRPATGTALGQGEVGVAAELERLGILLVQDKALPNVAAIVADAPVRGSWWAHPKSHSIFAAIEQLEEDRDVVLTRLVGGKVTFLHRRLWPDFLAVAVSGEPWQSRRLSRPARTLLAVIRGEGETRSKGDPARELQTRLLVHAEEVHTESGRHETLLRSWESWTRGAKVRPSRDVERAKRRLEDTAKRVGIPAKLLPWNRF